MQDSPRRDRTAQEGHADAEGWVLRVDGFERFIGPHQLIVAPIHGSATGMQWYGAVRFAESPTTTRRYGFAGLDSPGPFGSAEQAQLWCIQKLQALMWVVKPKKARKAK